MKRRWIQDSPVRADWGIDPFPCGATIGHVWADIFARHDAPPVVSLPAAEQATTPGHPCQAPDNPRFPSMPPILRYAVTPAGPLPCHKILVCRDTIIV